jgi:hypothetical protein
MDSFQFKNDSYNDSYNYSKYDSECNNIDSSDSSFHIYDNYIHEEKTAIYYDSSYINYKPTCHKCQIGKDIDSPCNYCN